MVFNKLERVYKNLPIKRKFILVLYILIVIPLITVSIMSYDISSKAIETKAVEHSRDMLSIIRYRLLDLLKGLEQSSQDLMYHDSVYQAVIKKKLEPTPAYVYDEHRQVVDALRNLLLARDEINSAEIVSFSGRRFYADNHTEKSSIGMMYDIADMVDKACKAQGQPYWYISHKEGMESYVFLLREILNREDSSEAGIMILGINKDYLTEAFFRPESETVRNLGVVDAQGNVIFSSSPEAGDAIHGIGFAGMMDAYEFSAGNNLFKASLSLDQPQWRVVTYMPLNELYRDIYRLTGRILWVCFFVLITTSALGWYAAGDIIKPIRELVRQMKRFQAGKSKALVKVDRQDELGYLSNTYNKMVDDMSHLMHSIYREQITRKEAELKALQTQMNPHFLFNTLESVNWMAQMQNVPEISDTVTNLSSLIEASIGRDSKLITLEEEFAYINQYVSIIRRRLGDRLKFKVNMDDRVMSVQIPRLLVQPIVENAVYHGIERVRRDGIIELTAESFEDKLIITVYDNGAGIAENELVRIRERLNMKDNDYFMMVWKKGKSVGIENVNRRIKLFYGQGYGLQIESEEDRYTRITATIPLKIRKDMEGFYVQSNDH